MKRDEPGDEDLMREAVSLTERIEFRISWSDHKTPRDSVITLGVNAHQWLSVYLGQDPMYRFDHLGRLRRAFVDGFLYRTSGKTLARLERQGVDAASQTSVLARRDLSAVELDEFRRRTKAQIDELRSGLSDESVTRRFPEDDNSLVTRFRTRLELVADTPDFLAPSIVRR